MPGINYYSAKALGVCPGHPERPPEAGHYHCTECLEGFSPGRTRHKEMQRQRPLVPPISAANLVACCGRWHAIHILPLTTPCCGRTYFTEDP